MIKSAVIFFSPGLLLFAADAVPVLNVSSSCQTAAKEATVAARDFKSCVADEHAARDKLAKDWARFAAADRLRCTQLASISPSQSYIQLLTCVEFAKEARDSKTASEQPAKPVTR